MTISVEAMNELKNFKMFKDSKVEAKVVVEDTVIGLTNKALVNLETSYVSDSRVALYVVDMVKKNWYFSGWAYEAKQAMLSHCDKVVKQGWRVLTLA